MGKLSYVLCSICFKQLFDWKRNFVIFGLFFGSFRITKIQEDKINLSKGILDVLYLYT